MVLPTVPARVEQKDDRVGVGVERGDVRPLMKVAAVAGQREVRFVVATAVLLGADVLDVKGRVGRGFGQVAVLAPAASPATD